MGSSEEETSPAEPVAEEIGFRPRQMRFWKKLSWEFGWDFIPHKIGPKLWTFTVKKPFKDRFVIFECQTRHEACMWWGGQVKAPEMREQRTMLAIFWNHEDAPKECPE
jgi:hypothetical protein